ncbi:MAG: carbon storage regulator [Pirellulales bacterium]|nr:carbon storage regulator [Pirellulales bacterium]
MLVLGRKCGETVHIGQDVTVTFLEMHGRSMKIGIDAPRSVGIRRGELRDHDGLAGPVDHRVRGDSVTFLADC